MAFRISDMNVIEHDTNSDAISSIRSLCAERGVNPAGRDGMLGVMDTQGASIEQPGTNAAVEHVPERDTLTGLYTRAYFNQVLEDRLTGGRTALRDVTLMIVNVDHFSDVNAALGYRNGDAYLRLVAERLLSLSRGPGILARFGGDEFAIASFERAGPEEVANSADRIFQEFRRPLCTRSFSLECRISIGGAVRGSDAVTVTELVRRASLAVKAAKRDGGNRFEAFSEEMREPATGRIASIVRAREALAEDRILPFYHPQIDLRSGQLVGYEALLRWWHPRDGICGPQLLMAAFEDAETAAQLGDRMLVRASTDMTGWRDRDVDFGRVAINVSSAELRDRAYPSRVLHALKCRSIPPNRLGIEITEAALIDGYEATVSDNLATLRAAGVTIAFDDFGTGYASLAHLRRIPVDILKIHQNFVRDLATSPQDRAIVRAIIELGKTLGITVIAEGIELRQQEEVLVAGGCHVGQGHLFSKPIAGHRVPYFTSNWSWRRPASDTSSDALP
jgi:diguanylate cyclase (GGDEF)-like protein